MDAKIRCIQQPWRGRKKEEKEREEKERGDKTENTEQKRRRKEDSEERDSEVEELGETRHAEEDGEYEPSDPKKRIGDTVTVQISKKVLGSSEVVEMLDRTKLSPRTAVSVVAAVIKKADADLNDFDLSVTSTRRTKDRQRKATDSAVLSDFVANMPATCALHWDGKLIDNVHGTKDERLAVLVSGAPNYIEGKLLGVPTLCDQNGRPTSSGLAQSEAVLALVEEFELKDKLVVLVFDTTASNTGRNRGAAIRLQQSLRKPLLMFGCRHHFAELIAKAAWYALFQEDLGPENSLFQEFKARWDKLEPSSAAPEKLLSLTRRSPVLVQLKTAAVRTYHQVLQQRLLRDDRREAAELGLALLGEAPLSGRSPWRKPGAAHKARFLSFSLYAMKMFMFSNQMAYNNEMVTALTRVTKFLALIYVPYYLQAGRSVDAPVNDLRLYQNFFLLQVRGGKITF